MFKLGRAADKRRSLGCSMTNVPNSYAPVWFSTDRQMEALISAYKAASLGAKMAGRFAVPNDAASLRGVLAPWMRVPLVLMAQGELSINESEVSFRSKPHRAFGWSVRSPHKNLSFRLAREEILAIEPSDFTSPVMPIFDLPFTRVQTTAEAPLNNFLLCVGGRIAIPRIRARSQELRQHLLSWHRGHEGLA